AGRSIGVFNLGGEFFALRNRCPHQGGPLCEGRVWGALEAERPGEFRYSRGGEILACIWHGWEFDIRTGQSWCDPARLRVRRYEVEVETGAAIAAPGGSAAGDPDPEAPAPGVVKGPYLAETYAVTAEDDYLVIEVPS
ncbi:MAG TPA: Rieske 2Fe-2S domain-containing protein, partial [Chloroflexota bacterium]|nr:Rieske 2Fe-2S domain-containing protein [Chloroflexota bacterium]